MKFTKPRIAALPLPTDKPEAFVWDDALPGFGIRLRASGARRFVVQYRESSGATRRAVLGDPRLVDLDKAKEAARTLLAEVRLGADPQAKKVKARNALTFAQIIERYLAAVGPSLRAGTIDAVRRHLEVHSKVLHGKPAGLVARADIAALLGDVARDRGPVAANRTRASLSALWTWGVMEGLVQANPVTGTMVRPETSRDRTLGDPELAAIWGGTDTGSDHDRITRLLLLTGCRRDEIGGMRWAEIEGNLFTLPASRSKNRLPHEVPLTSLAVAQLPPRQPERQAVFGKCDGGYSGWSRSKARLDGRLKLAQWGMHDLRRSCATWLSDHGEQPHIVEALLNHVSGTAKRGTAGIYNRAVYRTQKLAALERWANHIAAITGQTTANLVMMRRG
jgi:integrase